jgi:hypothetical protein
MDDWTTTEIRISCHNDRDHQVVNKHDHGTIRVETGAGMQNTNHTVYYGYADRDEKVAWFSCITDPKGKELEELNEMYDEDFYNIEGARGKFRELADPEVEWLGFDIITEPPEWHYTPDSF